MLKRTKKARTWRREGIKVREKVKGSGVWWVFVAEGKGRQRSVRCGTKEAADQTASDIRGEMEIAAASRRLEVAGILAPALSAATGTTFGVYAARFLDRNKPTESRGDEPDENDRETLKQSTWVDYKGCVENRLSPALGDLTLRAIRRRHAKDLEAKWRTDGLSAVNIRKHVRSLSSILSEAAEDELIDVNPLLNRGRRRRSKGKAPARKSRNPFSRAELDTLLQTAAEHCIERRGEMVSPFRDALPLLLTLADTGMRLGEAFALRWSDIDWRGGFIHIQRSHTHGALSFTKSGKNRHVEMSARLRAALRQLRGERFGRVVALSAAAQATIEAEQADRSSSALVFPDSTGGYLDESNVRRRIWLPLLTAAELSHHRLHDLRHTFATLHLDAGTNPVWVSDQLGHHDVGFTLRTYVGRPKGDQRRYADVLSQKWSQNDPATEKDAAEEATPGGLPQSDSVPRPSRAHSSVG